MQIQSLQSWRKSTLDKYSVKISPKAVRDLDSIYEYIASDKSAPENARAQLDRIKQSVLNLSSFPYSHQERMEGRYAGTGYRQLLVDNYIIIYRIDEINKAVLVITVQYNGRNI